MITIYYHDLPVLEVSDMIDYCHENNLSLAKFENMDTSDVSGQWDTLCMFQFTKEEDAVMFKLKFKCPKQY